MDHRRHHRVPPTPVARDGAATRRGRSHWGPVVRDETATRRVPGRSGPGRRTVVRPLTALGLALTLLAGACGGSTDSRGAPVLTVVTALWPFAQAAQEIGQGNVHVVDVVPPGQDPRTYVLTASERSEVRAAGVVVEVGGGFQPSFESAAAGAHRTVHVLPGKGASPYVWLSPYKMQAAVALVADAMEAADPKADSTYRTGLENTDSELSSLDADFQSTLSSCPEQDLVTIDSAFAVLHPRYPVVDTAVAVGSLSPLPSAATVAAEVTAIRATGAKKIYNETWVPESDILAATSRTDVGVGTLDTLEGPPTATPWPYSAGQKYSSLLEADLSTISSALHCPNPADN